MLPIILTLSLSFVAQFLLWFNLLFPYNMFFEGFNRSLYLVFSLSDIFVACISIVFYRMLLLDKMDGKILLIASIFQFLCILSCVFFAFSSLTGWLPV